MDYEKKYKEAMNIAKKLINDLREGEDILAVSELETMFPELKESEDEKTRKELIEFVKSRGGFKQEYITWLEKQGKCETDCHHNHQDANYPNGCIVLEDFNGGEGFYKVHLDYLNKKQVGEIEEMIRAWNKDSKVPNENIKSCIGMCLTDACEQRFRDYNTSLKDCLAWLEKQDEQKLIIDGILTATNYDKMFQNCKVHMFKAGDWIISKYMHLVMQILNDDNGFYKTVETDGTERNDSYDFIERNFKLWKLKDAKDGDVLHCWIDGDEFVLIYKGIKDGYITTYGHLYHKLESFSEEPTTMFCRTIQGHFTPATKEQCDMLFQKMKEAGYEWDAEKKELKKIVKKPVEWSEDDDNMLEAILHTLGKIVRYKNFDGAVMSSCENAASWLKSLKQRLGEQQ